MSAVVSAVGSIMGGRSEARALKFNQRQAELEAEAQRREAAAEAARAAEDAERTIGRAVAAAGSSGFTLAGSAADVIGDLGQQANYNVRAIVTQGENERTRLLAEARELGRQAKTARRLGYVRAAATLLGAAERNAEKANAAKAGG